MAAGEGAQIPGSLWHHRNFLKLWAGQTLSQIGEQISALALPLTAILVLHAGPEAMGALNAAQMLPFLVLGLFVGVLVDRTRRRSLMLVADLSRLLLLAMVPLMAALHMLVLQDLYGIAFLFGTATVVFDVAYQSYLPFLVSRAAVVEGNGKLETTRALAQVAGPGLGGMLVQVITAPVALLVNSLTYLMSVLSLLTIRAKEPVPEPRSDIGVMALVAVNVRYVFSDPRLRAIAGCSGTANLFGSISAAVYMLYAVHGIGLSVAMLGFVLAAGSVGAVIGSGMTLAVGRWMGIGRAIIWGMVVSSIGAWLVVLAAPKSSVALALLIAARVLTSGAGIIYNVSHVSLRQAMTPSALLGRTTATMRFVIRGVMPIGSVIGGVLGASIGIRPTLLVAAVGGSFAVVWLLLSPLRRMPSLPAYPIQVPLGEGSGAR